MCYTKPVKVNTCTELTILHNWFQINKSHTVVLLKYYVPQAATMVDISALSRIVSLN